MVVSGEADRRDEMYLAHGTVSWTASFITALWAAEVEKGNLATCPPARR